MNAYLTGFANHFASEAEPNTLPQGQNSPQRVAHGLYAEQLSGSAFTAPRGHNLRSWLYRIRPSVLHGEFVRLNHLYVTDPATSPCTSPNQLRWDPLPEPDTATDFIDGLRTFACNGQAANLNGAAIYLYACNRSMTDRYFYSADGELLLIPQMGNLTITTEFGIIDSQPGEIVVIPRGVKFSVALRDKSARGYLCENFGHPFRLPDLGPIGANGLANPRDFLTPVAAYEQKTGEFELIAKFHHHLWSAPLRHSPFDVVAWHGNYAPYKYNLQHFCTLNSVSFDHPDPSIFTVLTSPSTTTGVANVDFVIFPARWMVAEHTFRPPYFHRNIMSEFMGLIYGEYDAKQTGFVPGSSSLHNCMSAHGPDTQAFIQASQAELKPEYYNSTLAFMLESRYAWQPTEYALNCPQRQPNYRQCWQDLPLQFKI